MAEVAGASVAASEPTLSDEEPIIMRPLEEGEFIVEKILYKSMIGGKPHYFIKWKGFPDFENTWEPVDNLTCDKLLADFEIELAKKEGRPPPFPLLPQARKEGSNSSAPGSVSAKKGKGRGKTRRGVSAKKAGVTPRTVSSVGKKAGTTPRTVSGGKKGSRGRHLRAAVQAEIAPSPQPEQDPSNANGDSDATVDIDNVVTIHIPEDPEIVKELEGILTSLPHNQTPITMCYTQHLVLSQQLTYLIVWRDNDTLEMIDDWILADVFRPAYPQIVIEFYESILKLSDDERATTDILQRAYKTFADAEQRHKQLVAKKEAMTQKLANGIDCGDMDSDDDDMDVVDAGNDNGDDEDDKENQKVPLLESDTSSSDDESSSEDDMFRPINMGALTH